MSLSSEFEFKLKAIIEVNFINEFELLKKAEWLCLELAELNETN